MDLKEAKLGDQYRVYVDERKHLSASPSMHTMLTTVIAVAKKAYGTAIILGWKANEERPFDAVERTFASLENDYVPNENAFKYGLAISRQYKVGVQIFDGLDGFPCKHCTNFYPMAVPNRPDGTLLCWSCRDGK